jgi:hypothetical protein
MDSRRHAQENEPELSPLEQEVLDEYAKLVGNLDDVCRITCRPSLRSFADNNVSSLVY